MFKHRESDLPITGSRPVETTKTNPDSGGWRSQNNGDPDPRGKIIVNPEKNAAFFLHDSKVLLSFGFATATIFVFLGSLANLHN